MSTNGEWRNHIRAQGDHIEALIREECAESLVEMFPHMVEDIPRIFSAFQCGDPDRVQSMLDSLEEAKWVLQKDLNLHLAGAVKDMDGWTGTAAEDFTTFLFNLRDAMDLLLAVVDVLVLILRAYQALVLAMRNDALTLTEKTLQAYEEAGADEWKIALAIAGAIVGVVAGFAAGPAAPAVWGAVSGALAAGGTSVAGEVIGADSQLGALLTINKTGPSLISKIDGERAKLEQALRDLTGFVSGAKLEEIRPDRPEVITAPSFDPRSFGMTDEAQGGHRRPTDQTDLLPEPKREADGPYDESVFGDRYQEQGPS